jgi:hypothetical protein
MPWEIQPIVALLVERCAPLNTDELDRVWSLLQIELISLDRHSESFYLKLIKVCQSVASEEVKKYSVNKIEASEFQDCFNLCDECGDITSEVKAAAKRFLNFISENPEYWPLRDNNAGT